MKNASASHDAHTNALRQADFHLPRLLASGVDYNDFLIVRSRIASWRNWPEEWERLAAMHERLAADALGAKRFTTAGEAFARAATYFHFAQATLFDDLDEKIRIQQRQGNASLTGMSHYRPPGERLEIPFESFSFPANLRVPDSTGPVPCIILNAGADSTKEEFYTLENEFLKRGLATCSYDGPGQGLSWHMQKLRPDFEKPVGSLLDVLEKDTRLDSGRFGIWGRSMGGYAAPRVAAFDARIKACVSAGGFFDLLTNWDSGPRALHEALCFAFGVDNFAEGRECAKAFTLEGILGNVSCPTLIVHSGGDVVMQASDATRMRDAIGASAELVIFPEGTHVCDNIPYKIRPLVSDWLHEQLSR